MKRILLQFHKGMWAAVLTVLVTVTGVAAAGQAIQKDKQTEAQKAAESEVRFWRVVAGVEAGSSPTVDVLLARDLRGLSSSQVNEFQGNSNRYGGITDAIGYDPFDETGLDCLECGPLDPYTKQNLSTIRQGGLEQVLDSIVVPSPSTGLALTPLGMSVPLYLILLWAVGGPFTLAGAHYAAKFTNERYAAVRRFDDLWTEDETVSREQVLLAPTFFLPYLLYRSAIHRNFQQRVRDMFPQQMEAIDSFDRALERAPVDLGQWQILREKRNEVVRELESQTRSGEGTDDDISRLMKSIQDVGEYLSIREDAKRELR